MLCFSLGIAFIYTFFGILVAVFPYFLQDRHSQEQKGKFIPDSFQNVKVLQK